jgi:hypothetical protein
VVRAHGPFGTREVRHLYAKGHPDHPLTDEELLAKFRANLRYAKATDDTASDLAGAILSIDSVPDVRALSDAIAGSVSG